MATICKEILIDAPPEQVWDALRDFGALHERLVPGFVVAAELHGDVRVITFFNGAVAQERLVASDDASRRLAYTVIDGPLNATHHNASGPGRTRSGRAQPLRLDRRRAAARARSTDERAHGARASA